MRHVRRRRHRHPKRNYVIPHKLTVKRDAFGQPIPGQHERHPLPEALFAPGATDEDQRLSDAVSHKGQLFWHERVEVTSTDRIEIPEHGEWRMSGHPNHWPQGTVVVIERSK